MNSDTFIDGWLGGVVILFGIVGNVLSFVTLTRPRLRGSNSSLYLILLSVVDLIYLLVEFLGFALDEIINWNHEKETLFQLYYIRPARIVFIPVGNTAIIASVYITIALTIDRCYSVVKPLNWYRVCKRSRIKKILVAVCLWSVLCNLPFSFIYKLQDVDSDVHNVTYVAAVRTEYYKTYFHTTIYSVFLYRIISLVIPVLSTLICNCLIIFKVKCSRNIISSSGSTSARAIEANRLTSQVLCISILTFVSRVLQSLHYIIKYIEGINTYDPCSSACLSFGVTAHFFVRLNSATNFIFYCYFGQRFRKVFWSLFCCCSKRHEEVMRPGRGRRSIFATNSSQGEGKVTMFTSIGDSKL